VVFTAGAGEHRPLVREKSLEGLEEMGIILDREKNSSTTDSEGEISSRESKIKVFVIPTNEELGIALDTYIHSS